jgi:hypothetical protein
VTALALSAPLSAQVLPDEGWQFEPKISLAAVYSDNVDLAEAGQERSEVVMQLAPQLALKRKSQRLDLDLNYGFQQLAYQRESARNESFQQADAHVAAELVRSRFYVDVNGALTQQIVDPEGAFPPSNLPLSANRTDAVNASVAPYWRQRLGGVGDLMMRYERGIVRYQDPPASLGTLRLEDLDRQLAIVSLTSPEQRQGTTWGFDYRYDRQDFQTFSEVEFEQASVNVGYKLTPAVRIFGSGGEESDYRKHRSRAELDDPFWEAGVAYATPERDDLSFTVGKRTFGHTLGLNWTHLFRGFTSNLHYFEEPSTNAQTRFDVNDLPLQVTEVGLNRPDDGSIFVRKRLEGALEWDRGRSVWTFGLYGEQRSDRVQDPSSTVRLGTERTRGTNAGWQWQAGARTDLGFGVEWERSEFTDGRAFDLVHGRVEAHYALGEHTGLRLKLERASRGGDPARTVASGDIANFDENRVSLFVERSFF